MTKEELFMLYQKVQQNDKEAKRKLRELHRSKYPHHHPNGATYLSMHQMYLHLYR